MLSAIYIKGFKTFARPVRMPLEGGITAIVGPNGSGKSNITDAVLFALGEQSPGVLRAGAMGDLIFSGSVDTRYEMALRRIGVDPGMLSMEAGHA